MDNPRVSDISLLDTPQGPPGRDGRLTRFLGEIVRAGSLLAPGEFQLSGLGCRRRPQRRPCPGKIRLGRQLETDEIHWCCEACGDQGLITNWQQSRWDLQPELQRGRIISLPLERARRNRGAGLNRLQSYDLSVELIHAPFLLEERVLRQVRITGDSTLEELHTCLHAAFDRSDEQPYEFMFGPPYDPETRRFSGPGSATDEGEGFWDTRLIRLDSLGLRCGDSFGYLYDFNDEWVHRITVTAAQEASRPMGPQVLARVGSSPLRQEEEAPWRELPGSCPMSSLFGPYRAEEAPVPDDWLALDDLERQLLVMESHSAELPQQHPQITSMLLHALVHSLAETHLAERSGQGSFEEVRAGDAASRHCSIHQLGVLLIRQQLDACAEPLEPLRSRSKLRRKSKDPE